MEAITVGIDVSKDRLDVAVRPGGAAFIVERTGAGLEALVTRLIELAPGRIGLEATGGFETVVTAALARSAGLARRKRGQATGEGIVTLGQCARAARY